MPKLAATCLKLLKSFHVVFAVAWMRTVLGFLLELATIFPEQGEMSL